MIDIVSAIQKKDKLYFDDELWYLCRISFDWNICPLSDWCLYVSVNTVIAGSDYDNSLLELLEQMEVNCKTGTLEQPSTSLESIYEHVLSRKCPWRYRLIHGSHCVRPQRVSTLRQRQNGRHFTDDIFKCIFLNENLWILITISLKCFPRCPINNNPALFLIMA